MYRLIPVDEYVLKCRLRFSSDEESAPEWKEVYRGSSRTVTIDRLTSGVEYDFCVAAVCRRTSCGLGTFSGTSRIRTLKPTKEPFYLPQGWSECWDPVAEITYYCNKKDRSTQWAHPNAISGEEDITLPFRKRRLQFLHSLYESLPKVENAPLLKVLVRRTHVLEDSYEELRFVESHLWSRKLTISFVGEDGIDSGGMRNEWYHLVSKEFLRSGLVFQTDSSEDYFISSFVEPEKMDIFYFLGRFMGKALYDKNNVTLPFCSLLWKLLLGVQPVMQDLRSVDPVLHQSLEWILLNDVTDIIYETFAVLSPTGEEIELIPDGANIDVDESNKKEYVDHLVNFKLFGSIATQLDLVRNGFYDIVSPRVINLLQVKDLELVLNGSPVIQVANLKRNAVYTNGYSDKSRPVELFWRVFKNASPDEQGKILSFITGSSKMPLEDISIQVCKSDDGPGALPKSHTCFNQLVLPCYESELQTRERLVVAIENATGFFMT